MILTFRPIKVWPADWKRLHQTRPTTPFSATYADTLDLLDRELTALRATDVLLQVDASDRDMRLDGQLRADAKVGHPGCILSFTTPKHGVLTYPCDRFERAGWGHGREQASWKHNLRAIALGLEALRKVERYGIAERGQQYAGYREIGAGAPIEMGSAMTVEEAVCFFAQHGAGVGNWDDPDVLDAAFRQVAKTLHPDAGGDPDAFRQLTEARDLLGET